MSTPAVVFSLGFTYDWAIGGYDFLEYMDRPEAFDKTRHLNDEYKDFIDYMSNSEKSDGLFNAQSDLLTESDKEKYRQLETVSRDAGCPKYYGVVSFDNSFLIENGLMTSEGKLDVHGIKELGREGINAMISTSNKLDNDNVYWTGAITFTYISPYANMSGVRTAVRYIVTRIVSRSKHSINSSQRS